MKKLILALTLISAPALADNTNVGNNNNINNGTQVSGVGNTVGGTHAGNIDVSNRNNQQQGQLQGQLQGQHQSSRNDNSNDGNSQVTTFSQKRQTASAYAPALTTGFDTCTGSMSAGVSTGVAGVSIGGTTVDENCVRLKNSERAARMGYKKAALAIMCQNDDFRAAMQFEDEKCPQSKEPEKAVAPKTNCDYPSGRRDLNC